MMPTLAVLACVCALSLFYVLVIPPLASTKLFLRFFPEMKDCKSWNDRSFNKSNQRKRLIAFPFVCALMAWLTVWIGKG